MAVPDLPYVYNVFAHHDCVHNQIVSIHNRVCGRVPVANEQAMLLLRRYMLKIARSLPRVAPWALEDVVSHYHGVKRARYAEAAEEYLANGLTRAESNVKMFIKCEKIRFTDGKVNPDPRAIQFRNPIFSVVVAQYFKAIEDVVYRLKGNRLNNLPTGRVFGKGLDQTAKATMFIDKWRAFNKPVAISLDASRFDQHIDVPHLRCLHAFYLQMVHAPDFEKYLSWTITNRVCTSRGIKYTAEGGRMSGDMDTALGACLLMLSMLGLYFEGKTIHWDCQDDGDDIILIVESHMLQQMLDELPSHFLALGQEIKVENIAYEPEEVVWCQSSPVLFPEGYRFIRNPSKVLSGALVGNKWLQMKSTKARRKLANTIGLGELYMNRGVPILQEFALAIIRCADTKGQVKLAHHDSLLYKVRHEAGKPWMDKIPTCSARPVADETRHSFSMAFGIDIGEQLQAEEYLRSWSFNLEDPEMHPSPVDVKHWRWEAFDIERY